MLLLPALSAAAARCGCPFLAPPANAYPAISSVPSGAALVVAAHRSSRQNFARNVSPAQFQRHLSAPTAPADIDTQATIVQDNGRAMVCGGKPTFKHMT